MLINALRLASGTEMELLKDWLKRTDYNPAEKIGAVTAIYDRLGIKELCEKKMKEYYDKATVLLDAVEVEDKYRSPLSALAADLMYRES